MTDTFRCGDPEALITYLYDEGEAPERAAIAAHIARCPTCADEIASLQSARSSLASWSPPDAALGFRVTRSEERPQPVVLRPAAWWRQPLPAWAQAAAAVLIFAAGLIAGQIGDAGPAEQVADAPARLAAPPAAAAPAPAMTPASARADGTAAAAGAATAALGEDLARLEQRLRALERGAAATGVQNAAAPQTIDERALLQRVQALLDASEDRQRRENITLISSVVRDFDVQRRVDLRQVEDRLSRLHDNTGVALRQQNELANYLMRNVSQTGAPGVR